MVTPAYEYDDFDTDVTMINVVNGRNKQGIKAVYSYTPAYLRKDTPLANELNINETENLKYLIQPENHSVKVAGLLATALSEEIKNRDEQDNTQVDLLLTPAFLTEQFKHNFQNAIKETGIDNPVSLKPSNAILKVIQAKIKTENQLTRRINRVLDVSESWGSIDSNKDMTKGYSNLLEKHGINGKVPTKELKLAVLNTTNDPNNKNGISVVVLRPETEKQTLKALSAMGKVDVVMASQNSESNAIYLSTDNKPMLNTGITPDTLTNVLELRKTQIIESQKEKHPEVVLEKKLQERQAPTQKPPQQQQAMSVNHGQGRF